MDKKTNFVERGESNAAQMNRRSRFANDLSMDIGIVGFITTKQYLIQLIFELKGRFYEKDG